jgi:hypothetical protein
MEPPQLNVDPPVQHQSINVGEERIEELVAKLFAVLGVECPTSSKVPERGWQDPQPHEITFGGRASLRPSP